MSYSKNGVRTIGRPKSTYTFKTWIVLRWIWLINRLEMSDVIPWIIHGMFLGKIIILWANFGSVHIEFESLKKFC